MGRPKENKVRYNLALSPTAIMGFEQLRIKAAAPDLDTVIESIGVRLANGEIVFNTKKESGVDA